MDDPFIDAHDLCPETVRLIRRKSSVWTSARAKADIVLCDVDAILKVVNERQAICFVWEEEGAFQTNGAWKFNEKHEDFEPLLLDLNSADLLNSLFEKIEKMGGLTSGGELRHDAMKRQLKESRAYLVKYHEFVWKHAGF